MNRPTETYNDLGRETVILLMRYICFKYGKEIKENEKAVFSFEWDAFCHEECCPAYNPRAKVTRECELCEQY